MGDVLTGKVTGMHDGEVHIERPDGSRIIVIVNISPLKNDRGEITGAINCFYDVTERKRSEEALRESASSARLSSMMSGTRSGVAKESLVSMGDLPKLPM
jgi:PAS domain-containing protein